MLGEVHCGGGRYVEGMPPIKCLKFCCLGLLLLDIRLLNFWGGLLLGCGGGGGLFAGVLGGGLFAGVWGGGSICWGAGWADD